MQALIAIHKGLEMNYNVILTENLKKSTVRPFDDGGQVAIHTQIIDDLSNLINEIHTNPRCNVNIIHHGNTLQSAVSFGIIFTQSEKVTASREKLNIQTLAQNTPNACFFMRNIRTPQENADFVLFVQNLIILSMVERSGKGFALCCFPKLAVSHPVTFYRPTVRSLAVDSTNLTLESTQMYQFIFALMRTPTQCLKIRVLADNEQQARARFTDGETLLFVGRINLHRQLTPLVEVKPESVNIHTLPKSQDVGIIHSTTTIEGTRNPYQCGFFISQIPFNGYAQNERTYHQAEFAVRLRDRNKAHTRTNKIRRSIAVVDTVSHPTTGDTFQQTKSIGNPTMKIYSQNNRTFADNPALSVSAVMGVNHA